MKTSRWRGIVSLSVALALFLSAALGLPMHARAVSLNAELGSSDAAITFELDGTRYEYSYLCTDDERSAQLTDLSTGETRNYRYVISTGDLYVSGELVQRIQLGEAGLEEPDFQPLSEIVWQGSGFTDAYIDWGATATALDIVIRICLIIGAPAIAYTVYDMIAPTVVDIMGYCGGMYFSYDIQISTVGLIQNQRIVLYLKPPGQNIGPYYIYLPPAARMIEVTK